MTRRSFGALRKLPSGRYQARYTHPTTGRQYRGPHTWTNKVDAEGWLSGERQLIELNAWTDPATRGMPARTVTPTVEAWCASVIEQRSQRSRKPLKKSTVDLYSKLVRLTIAGTPLGSTGLDEVTRDAVRAWRDGLDRANPMQNGKAFEFLSSALGEAVTEGKIPLNPAANIKGARSPERAREPEVLDTAELGRYLTAIPARHRVALLITATCGLRIGETLALRVRDYEPKRGTVRIAGTLAKISTDAPGRRQVVRQKPKTDASVREVHVLPLHLDELAAWHAQLGGTPNDLAFTSDAGQPINDDVIRRAHKKAAAAIGRPELRLHDLRATAATLAAAQGATVREIQNLLGHTTANMALRYQRATAERDAERAKRASDALRLSSLD